MPLKRKPGRPRKHEVGSETSDNLSDMLEKLKRDAAAKIDVKAGKQLQSESDTV